MILHPAHVSDRMREAEPSDIFLLSFDITKNDEKHGKNNEFTNVFTIFQQLMVVRIILLLYLSYVQQFVLQELNLHQHYLQYY